MHEILAMLCLALGLVACGDDLPPSNLTPSDTTGSGCTQGNSPECATGGSTTGPPTTGVLSATGETTGGSTPEESSSGPATVGIPDECDISSDCGRGELCVAPFVPEFGPEGKGPNECVTECVVLMDELRWCLDAAACCDPQAECTDRGYCELVGTDESGGASESGSTGGSGTG